MSIKTGPYNQGTAATQPTSRFPYVVGSVAELASVPEGVRVDGAAFRTTEFWSDTNVGSVDLIWKADEPTENHNGGTIIDPLRLSALDPATKTFNGYHTPVTGSLGCFITEHSFDINPEHYGFLGAGNDEIIPVQAAINAAKSGSTIKFRKYAQPISVFGMSASEKSIAIDLGGNYINPQGNQRLFVFNGKFSDEQDVSSISVTEFNGNAVTEIITTTELLSPGDVVKIFSNDLIPDEWGSNRKLGEFATVSHVTSGSIVLDHYLYDHDRYQNSIKIARLEQHVPVIKNARVLCGGNTDLSGVISIVSAMTPVVSKIAIEGHDNSVFGLTSCYKYTVTMCRALRVGFDMSEGRRGYGINDTGCYHGVVRGFFMTGGRHGYTSNSLGAAGTDPRCGRTVGTLVNTGYCYGTETAAWDTHPGAIFVTFRDCVAENCSSFGKSRSYGTKFVRPVGRDCGQAIAFFGPAAGNSPLQEQYVIDPDIECDEIAFEINPTDGHPFTQPADVYVLGGVIRASGGQALGQMLRSLSPSAPFSFTFKGRFELASQDARDLIHVNTASGNRVDISGNFVLGVVADLTPVEYLVWWQGDESEADDLEVVVTDLTVFGAEGLRFVSRGGSLLHDGLRILQTGAGFELGTGSTTVRSWAFVS